MPNIDMLVAPLGALLSLPDAEAAEALSRRMAAFEMVTRMHERSYAERGLIIRAFEIRQLWKHLTDPDTGQPFPHLTAWLSCSSFLGCRRTNFESKADMELLKDLAPDRLIDVPKSNIKLLTQLSTAVRNDPGILDAARTLSREDFEQKLEREQPDQHINQRKWLRFSLEKDSAALVEEAIQQLIDNEYAANSNEALLRMAEIALREIDAGLPEA